MDLRKTARLPCRATVSVEKRRRSLWVAQCALSNSSSACRSSEFICTMEILSSWFSGKHIYKTPEFKIGHCKARAAVFLYLHNTPFKAIHVKLQGLPRGPRSKQDRGFRRIAGE